MKYINLYNTNELKIGDYVLCEEIGTDSKIYNFIKNNIGKLIRIDNSIFAPFIIKYNEAPNKLAKKYFVSEKGEESKPLLLVRLY